jgi:hypothetical protein
MNDVIAFTLSPFVTADLLTSNQPLNSQTSQIGITKFGERSHFGILLSSFNQDCGPGT